MSRIARRLENFLTSSADPPIRLRPSESVNLHRIVALVVRFAVAELRSSALLVEKMAAQSVWGGLGNYLSSRLVFALGPALRLQHAVAKAMAGSEGIHCAEITLNDVIVAFPGVLDLLARMIAGWIAAQRELLNRIVSDQDLLIQEFITHKRPFRVAYIRAGLSDPHDFGRTVSLVHFAGGDRVIYKPRPADCEQLWFEGLRWLNRNGVRLRFKIPKLALRNDYCWMEFVAPRSCKKLRDVHDFYLRWGAQASLAQLFLATDLHRGNWTASGAQPVLLDAELIGDAELPLRKDDPKRRRRRLALVLQTGLLPLTPQDRVGRYEELGPFDGRTLLVPLPDCWPKYKGARQHPRKFVSELIRGFESVAEIFTSGMASQKFFREVIAAQESRRERRILTQPSSQYLRLLRASVRPANLVSSEGRWRYLRSACSSGTSNRRIAHAEAQALLRCDIPKIKTRPTGALISWRRFSAAVAELKNAGRLFRNRILLKGSLRAKRRRRRNLSLSKLRTVFTR